MRRSKPWTLIAILSVVSLLFMLATQDSHTVFSKGGHSSQLITADWELCNPIVVGQQVVLGNQHPPKQLYFFGDYGSSWENTIGNHQKFKRKPFRKGLFVAETLADAEPVSLPSQGRFYGVSLKSECLQSERVSSMVGLPSLPKFKNWYNKIPDLDSLQDWKKKCFSDDGLPKSESFTFFETPNSIESECEKVVERFWSDQQIGLIQDHLTAKSWVIRDPACIEKVDGSPKYWVEILSNQPRHWGKSCESHKSQKERTRLYLDSLADVIVESPEAVDFASALSKLFPSNRSPAEASEKLPFKVEDFSDELSRAVARCKSLGGLSELKEGLRAITKNIKTMESLDIKTELERLCL